MPQRYALSLWGWMMTAKNFDHLLGSLQKLTPFQVFTVELNGGQRFEVDHANALVFRDGVAVFVGPGGIPHFFDHQSLNQVITAPAHLAE